MAEAKNTHPNLLDSQQSILVVVDMQTRLTAAMPEDLAQSMLSNAGKLLVGSSVLQIPVLVTEQYPQGLGPTDETIVKALPDATQRFEKTGFSCCAADGFDRSLQDSGRRQVILLGQETHVCVLQTALELQQRGFQVYVVADAVCSRRTEHKMFALQRMQQQGVTITNSESVLFEWLRDAQHADFKTVSALLR